MRQHGGSDSQLGGEPPEAGGARIVAHLGVVRGQRPIDRAGQRARLHRANPHDANLARPRCSHDSTGFCRSVKKLQPAGGIQKIGDALHRCWGRSLTQ